MLRLATLVVIVIQNQILNSKQAKYCIAYPEVLSSEGKWLQYLIYLQLVKLVIFSIWHIILLKSNYKDEVETADGPLPTPTPYNSSVDVVAKKKKKRSKKIKRNTKSEQNNNFLP